MERPDFEWFVQGCEYSEARERGLAEYVLYLEKENAELKMKLNAVVIQLERDAVETRGYRLCPTCGGDGERVNIEGTAVEDCPTCGGSGEVADV